MHLCARVCDRDREGNKRIGRECAGVRVVQACVIAEAAPSIVMDEHQGPMAVACRIAAYPA